MGKQDKTKAEEQRGYSPPADMQAEQATLGSILVRPELFDLVAEIVEPADFYREPHALIFRAMLDLYAKNQPVDLVTVSTLLRERGKIEAVGGYVFLAELSEQVGFASNARKYAAIVRDKARLRRVLDASQEIASQCLAPVNDVAEFIDQAEARFFEVSHGRQNSQIHNIGELSRADFERAEALFNAKREAHGLATGFYDYDRLTVGLHPGEITILAARPGMGKTALALNIAWHVAVKQGQPVAVFSLEMTKEQLTQRVIAGGGRIDGEHLRRNRLSSDEWAARARVQDRMEDAPLYLDDKPGLTALELRARCRRIKSRYGLALVVVDYLQLMRAPRLRSRDEEVSHNAYAIKELAKELGLPILVCCQVNREVEKRSGKRYQLADLRESGAIEQAADNILFLWREKEGITGDMDLAKQRTGRTGAFKLLYSGQFCRFDNYAGE